MALRSHRQAVENGTKLPSTRDEIVLRASLSADDGDLTSAAIALHCADGVATISIARNERQNSLDVSTARALRDAVDRYVHDKLMREIEELTRAANSENFADELITACTRFATQETKLS